MLSISQSIIDASVHLHGCLSTRKFVYSALDFARPRTDKSEDPYVYGEGAPFWPLMGAERSMDT